MFESTHNLCHCWRPFPETCFPPVALAGFWSMNKGLGRIKKHLRAVGETCSWPLSLPAHPWGTSLGASGAEEGPSTTVCPSWISPCCHTRQDYHSQAIGKEVHAGHAVCQKSLKTPSSHPCRYSNSFDFLKATPVCPGQWEASSHSTDTS